LIAFFIGSRKYRHSNVAPAQRRRVPPERAAALTAYVRALRSGTASAALLLWRTRGAMRYAACAKRCARVAARRVCRKAHSAADSASAQPVRASARARMPRGAHVLPPAAMLMPWRARSQQTLYAVNAANAPNVVATNVCHHPFRFSSSNVRLSASALLRCRALILPLIASCRFSRHYAITTLCDFFAILRR